MEFDDLITIKAFVVALKQLQQPLPLALRTQLDEIVEDLPELSYELPEVAASFPLLDKAYQTAIRQVIQDSGSEGERLKFAESARDSNGKPESRDWADLMEQLHVQLDRFQNDSEEEDPAMLTLYLNFLVQQAHENPDTLVPYTSEMSAELDDLLRDVVLD